MIPGISLVGDYRARLGEAAYWSANANALLWVDIKGRKIIRYCPETHSERLWSLSEQIGCIVDNPECSSFLAAIQSGFVAITLPDSSPEALIKPICDPETEIPANRFNDGAIDRDGYFWAGTMDDAEKIENGSWWRLGPDGQADKLISGFKVTNGPAFSPNGKYVFLTDSTKRTIFRGCYDKRCGIRDFAEWAQFDKEHGYPDGMTFGPDGNLWVAFWGGACVRALNPDGRIVKQIDLSVKRPTKIAFSPDGTAYVTSAMVNPREAETNGRLLSFRMD